MVDAHATSSNPASLHCRLCGFRLSGNELPLGWLPVCNRFTPRRTLPDRFELSLAQCTRCHLVQLGNPPPLDAIVPRVRWIRYREPEAHLATVVATLIDDLLPNARSAFGIGPFEAPLLDRLTSRGLTSLAIDARPPSGAAEHGFPYLETWQLGLSPARLAELAARHGKADIVSCRYLIEHCHDPVPALAGLRQLTAPGGLILVEVPDSARFLRARDYCFLWEEHLSYFVEDTLRLLAPRAGCEIVKFMRFEGVLEDTLIVLLRSSDMEFDVTAPAASGTVDFDRYRLDFTLARKNLGLKMQELAATPQHKLALFGIGHQAIMFANLMGIADLVQAAVDDDPDKRDLYPPGFRVPVTTSAELRDNPDIGTCLLAIHPAVEPKVRGNLAPLVERGVRFHSIFAGVPGSFLSELPPWH